MLSTPSGIFTHSMKGTQWNASKPMLLTDAGILSSSIRVNENIRQEETAGLLRAEVFQFLFRRKILLQWK